MKPTFFARASLIILTIVFFFVPFAMRGARLAIQGMKNDVKDWLPKDFPETGELAWFRDHFVSEQFVVVSWDKCYGGRDDARYQLFLAKLEAELPPTQVEKLAQQNAAVAQAQVLPADDAAEEEAELADDEEEESDGRIENPTRYFHREAFVGDDLGLYLTSEQHYDWGGQREKWVRGKATDKPGDRNEAWYYITPEGDLFRWKAVDSPIAALIRLISRQINGPSLEGELVASFGPKDGPWYHERPQRLRAHLFKSITTGPDVLASLTRSGGELATDPEEAVRRLTGTLLGPGDSNDPEAPRQTCIILTLTEAAKQNLHLVLGRGMLGKPKGLLYELAEECGIASKDGSGEGLWLGGPPVDNVSIDEEGTITLVRLVGLCVLVGVGLSLACFRSVTATIMVFFIGGISAVMSVAFVWWFGSSMDAILMSMPALVYVLGMMGATHIINYYHEAVTDNGYVGASERAISHAWKPALFCNITTAVGLLSLLTSELVPIQKFGLFSAIGVLATLAVLFTYLPAALQVWPQKKRERPAAGSEESWIDQRLGNLWQIVGSWIIRHHVGVSIACGIAIVGFCLGVGRMHTSVNMLKMFHSEAKIIRDYTKLEKKLGPLVPMEVVVTIPKASQRLSLAELAQLREHSPDEQVQMPFIERMELAARVQKAIEDEFGTNGRGIVGNATSAATFVRPLPGAYGDTFSWSTRNTISSRLEAHREDFLHSDYLRIDQKNGAELWRISIRIPATTGVDYGAFVEELKSAVEPILRAHHERDRVLRALAGLDKDSASNGGGSVRISGAKVLVLGMPAVAPARAKVGDPAAQAAATGKSKSIDQTRLFAETLRDLLKISRVKLTVDSAESDQPLDLAKAAAEQDCVVLVQDAGYDVEAIRQHAPRFIDARDHHFDPKQENLASKIAGSPAAVYTGVVPIVYKAQRTLLDSLISSSVWSFLTITPLMMFVSRSIRGGAVAMLPNVLPVVMVFGGMGWFGIAVDVGSMMTASIALGVAVDDTIHFLNWFRSELDRLGDRRQAILAAYKHCATPTFQAAIISGIGLSVFALSTFTPTQRFGFLMLTILWMGVVAELIFFPAILAGPLGSVFQPRKKRDQSHGHEEQAEASEAADELSLAAEKADGDGAATPHSGAGRLRVVRQEGSHGR